MPFLLQKDILSRVCSVALIFLCWCSHQILAKIETKVQISFIMIN